MTDLSHGTKSPRKTVSPVSELAINSKPEAPADPAAVGRYLRVLEEVRKSSVSKGPSWKLVATLLGLSLLAGLTAVGLGAAHYRELDLSYQTSAQTIAAYSTTVEAHQATITAFAELEKQATADAARSQKLKTQLTALVQVTQAATVPPTGTPPPSSPPPPDCGNPANFDFSLVGPSVQKPDTKSSDRTLVTWRIKNTGVCSLRNVGLLGGQYRELAVLVQDVDDAGGVTIVKPSDIVSVTLGLDSARLSTAGLFEWRLVSDSLILETEGLLPLTLSQSSETPVPKLPHAMPKGNNNLRSGPGTNYPTRGFLATDSVTKIIGRNSDSSWWQLDLPGKPWVSNTRITVDGDTTNVPIVLNIPPPPSPTKPSPTAPTLGATP